MIVRGIPNRKIAIFHRNCVMLLAMIVAEALASTHFVK